MTYIATTLSGKYIGITNNPNLTLEQLKIIKEVDGVVIYEITTQQYDEISSQGYDASLVEDIIVTSRGQDAINKTQTLLDDETLIMSSGEGFAILKIGLEWVEFSFNESGIVDIRISSNNVINTDIDGNICILNVGDHIEIKNRLGIEKKFTLEINNI